MPLEFDCPHCGARLTIPEEHAGRRGRCRYCDRSLVAPLLPSPEEGLVFGGADGSPTAEPSGSTASAPPSALAPWRFGREWRGLAILALILLTLVAVWLALGSRPRVAVSVPKAAGPAAPKPGSSREALVQPRRGTPFRLTGFRLGGFEETRTDDAIRGQLGDLQVTAPLSQIGALGFRFERTVETGSEGRTPPSREDLVVTVVSRRLGYRLPVRPYVAPSLAGRRQMAGAWFDFVGTPAEVQRVQLLGEAGRPPRASSTAPTGALVGELNAEVRTTSGATLSLEGVEALRVCDYGTGYSHMIFGPEIKEPGVGRTGEWLWPVEGGEIRVPLGWCREIDLGGRRLSLTNNRVIGGARELQASRELVGLGGVSAGRPAAVRLGAIKSLKITQRPAKPASAAQQVRRTHATSELQRGPVSAVTKGGKTQGVRWGFVGEYGEVRHSPGTDASAGLNDQELARAALGLGRVSRRPSERWTYLVASKENLTALPLETSPGVALAVELADITSFSRDGQGNAVLQLKDGTRLFGRVLGPTFLSVRTRDDGPVTRIPLEELQSAEWRTAEGARP